MSRAAVLVNLGSPESTKVKDVKRYLGEFLMDDHVIDYPFWARWLLVKGIILNVRPRKSAEAYKKIWRKDGSPLILISEALHKKVSARTAVPTYLAMRYAEPSILRTIKQAVSDQPNLKELYVVPLYPHFAMSSYETVVDRVKEVAAEYFPDLKLKFKSPWYNDAQYIKLLAESISETWPTDHHLLFSYHGIPVRHIRKSDPTGSHCQLNGECCGGESSVHATCYRHQTLETTRLVARELGLEKSQYSTSFQSRLGRDPWLEPYTAKMFETLPSKGTEKLAVVCPAFVSDCLETLEEIDQEGRESFLESGGTSFQSIPCLNDRDSWADLIAQWITTAQ